MRPLPLPLTSLCPRSLSVNPSIYRNNTIDAIDETKAPSVLDYRGFRDPSRPHEELLGFSALDRIRLYLKVAKC